MSACSLSDVRAIVGALLVAALLAPATAGARVTVNGVVLSDSAGERAGSVHVSGRGVVVGRNADVVIGTDTLGHGAIVIDDGTNGLVRVLTDAHVRPGEHFEGDVVSIFGNVKVEGQVAGAAVSVFGHVDIAPGATVGGDAVAVFGGLSSAGSVAGDAVAVFGTTRLAPGAVVGGDAVAVGGRVDDDAQARVVGQTVSVGVSPLTFGLPALSAVLGMIFIGWLITVFFGWLFAMLFPKRLVRVGVTSSRQTFFSILVAALSFLFWPVVSILIMATIIGFPVGLVLLFVQPLVVYAGQLGATYVLGCKLMRRRLGEGDVFGPIAAGSFLIALLFAAAAVCFSIGGVGGAFALFFGLVALLVLLGLTLIGTGAVLLSRVGSTPHDVGMPQASAASANG